MTSDVPPPTPDAPAAAPDAPLASAPVESVTLGNPAEVPQTPPEPKPAVPEDAPAAAPAYRPNYVFLGVVAFISLALDLGSKWWAKSRLDDVKDFADKSIVVVKDHLAFRFAQNRGGAWGLLQDEPESIRRPFFLGISFVAIAFIVSLYRKLTPQQWALKWGLPLVLGGALGNLVNRIQYNYVVDFIDYHAAWVKWLNGLMTQHPTDHWPTFNIADVAIVVGVILMAVDMFTPHKPALASPAAAPSAPPVEPPAMLGDAPKPPAPPAPKET